jgi:hypothetical protein
MLEGLKNVGRSFSRMTIKVLNGQIGKNVYHSTPPDWVLVGGLPLSKVLKNLTNMFFSIT